MSENMQTLINQPYLMTKDNR